MILEVSQYSKCCVTGLRENKQHEWQYYEAAVSGLSITAVVCFASSYTQQLFNVGLISSVLSHLDGEQH